MRKGLCLWFCIMLLGSMLISGCGTSNKNTTTTGQFNGQGETSNDSSPTFTIATSFYPMYIFTLNVAGNIPNVKVVNMTRPTTGCLHDYAITPDDMMILEKAQVMVINGAGLESFMDKVVQQMPNLKIIDASKGISLLKGDGDEGDNPHIWVSISDAITQVKNIGQQLAACDPEHAYLYQANSAAYVKKLEDQRAKMHQVLDALPNRDIITFHEAFPYFAREFNLNIAAVIEHEPGSEPSARELEDTVATVRKLKVKALFAEPQYPAKAIETIARETGTKVYVLDPAVTGPMEADAYIRIMDKNLQTLQEALQ